MTSTKLATNDSWVVVVVVVMTEVAILAGLLVVTVEIPVVFIDEVDLDDLVVVVVALVTVPIVDVFILVWVSNTVKRQ